MKNFKFAFIIFLAIGIMFAACSKEEESQKEEINPEEVKKMEAEFKEFSENLQNQFDSLYKAAALAEWEAQTTGKKEMFKLSSKNEIAMKQFLSQKDVFNKLKEYKESGLIQDELLQRELELLYNEFLGNQLSKETIEKMTNMQSEISQLYNKFRPVVNGKKVTDNKVEEILKTSKDNALLKEAWTASKEIGPLVADSVIKLVKIRNEAAKELGFENYHQMSLTLSEQDPEEISTLFDELDALTRDAFAELKHEMDSVLAQQYGIKPEELRPWHYQNRFFQEAPAIYELDLDKYYKGKNLEELSKKYYSSIGMPIDSMIAHSDLYEREGKNQHAFCTYIDKSKKDVRVLCNIKDNYNWMNTMLHEFGHAVYFKYHDQNLPWAMQWPAHTFTTEAIAMLFGRRASNPQYLQDVVGISAEEAAKIKETTYNILRLEQLVFSRWAQVMYRFEKSMYENPDQDLNKLWWDLVAKYQMITPPEGRDKPDWASKTHIANSPCYYHNYLLGELLASQLSTYMAKNIVNKENALDCSYYGSKEAGKYLIDKVFMPGARYNWNVMIEKATGEKLTPKYYAKQFVK